MSEIGLVNATKQVSQSEKIFNAVADLKALRIEINGFMRRLAGDDEIAKDGSVASVNPDAFWALWDNLPSMINESVSEIRTVFMELEGRLLG